MLQRAEREAGGGTLRSAPALPVLLHLTTVPMSLRFVAGQPAFMKRHGLLTHVASSPGVELDRFAAAEAVPAYRVEMSRRITPWRDLRSVAALWRLMRRIRPAIVHAHTPKGGLLGMIAATMAGVPIRIYHMRGLPFLGARGARRMLLRWTERIACRLAHRVFCVSASLRSVAVAQRLCAADRIVVPAQGGNGVDAAQRFNPDRLKPGVRRDTRRRLGIPDAAVVIGFVGRLVRDKGIDELARAWQLLRGRYPSAHLLMVGPFEAGDPISASTEAALRTDRRVHLTGADWNTPPLYAAMDIVVLPSYREGFPNVVVEAAAMALPVVATRIPGSVDAVQDGVTGLLVPPADAAALGSTLARYLDDAALRTRHGARGQQRVRQLFQPSQVWASLWSEYEQLLDRRGVHRRSMAIPEHGPSPVPRPDGAIA